MDKIILRLRRDSKQNWEKANFIILQIGELVCEVQEDGGLKYKIGDGQTSYCYLPYVSLGEEVTNFMVYAKNSLPIEIDLAFQKEKYIDKGTINEN